MRLFVLLFMSTCYVLGSIEIANAAIVLSIAPSATTLAPTGGTVTFTVSISSDSNETLRGYDFFFNVVGPQTVEFSNSNPLVAFDFPGTASGTSDFGRQGLNLISPAVSLANPVDLFTFDATFAANGSLVDEVYSIAFNQSDPGWGVVDGADNTLSISNAFPATITVTAVPEPGSLAVLGAVSCGVFVRFRRRLFCKTALPT